MLRVVTSHLLREICPTWMHPWGGTQHLDDFNTTINEEQYETATRNFEATLTEGKLYAGRYACLQKEAVEMNETIFGFRVGVGRLRGLMSDQSKR